MTRTRILGSSLVALLALGLAACSGSSKSSSGATSSSEKTGTTGGSGNAGGVPTDLCTAFTKQQVSGFVGVPVLSTTPIDDLRGRGCSWGLEGKRSGKADASVVITELTDQSGSFETIKEQAANSSGRFVYKPVSSVGDEAFFFGGAISQRPSLVVKVGDRAFMIELSPVGLSDYENSSEAIEEKELEIARAFLKN